MNRNVFYLLMFALGVGQMSCSENQSSDSNPTGVTTPATPSMSRWWSTPDEAQLSYFLDSLMPQLEVVQVINDSVPNSLRGVGQTIRGLNAYKAAVMQDTCLAEEIILLVDEHHQVVNYFPTKVLIYGCGLYKSLTTGFDNDTVFNQYLVTDEFGPILDPEHPEVGKGESFQASYVYHILPNGQLDTVSRNEEWVENL